MPDEVLLVVEGALESPLALTFHDLQAFAESEQVRDVSRVQPERRGDAVTLDAILARARPLPEASYLTLHASRDDFYVSIPLVPVRAQCIVVYSLEGGPLPTSEGGPLRLLVRDPAACRTSELDDCANIKHLDRIELTTGRGRDTRPTTVDDHDALHARQRS
jgi:DMSO/TMAO reductase YedYZ molybdopterin-dependent catalytic subunit